MRAPRGRDRDAILANCKYGASAATENGSAQSSTRSRAPRASGRSYRTFIREVSRQLTLELGEVFRDDFDVEAAQDRLRGLAVEQKPKRSFDAALRRHSRREAREIGGRERHPMPGLLVVLANDDIERQRIVAGLSRHLDHDPASCRQPCRRAGSPLYARRIPP